MSASHNYLKTVMSLTIFLYIIYSMVIIEPAYSKNGGLFFSTTYGEGGVDKVYDFCLTPDNGTILVGSTTSFGVEQEDVYVVRVDPNGKMIWNITWGGWESDRGYSILPTKDGNYVITGASRVVEAIGDDVLFLKVSDTGTVIAHNHYGGNSWDWGKDLAELSNGDILIAGVTEDFWISYYDCYVLRTTHNGEFIWRRTIDVEGNFDLNRMIESEDGHFLILGTASDELNDNNDIILIKIDENGKEIWRKIYGAEGRETGADIVDTGDGYLILGNSRSNTIEGYDTIVIKIDYQGEFLWSKNIGDVKDDISHRMIKTGQNEYTIVGQKYNTDNAGSDIVYMKIASNGKITALETYGSSVWEAGYLIEEAGNEIIIVGETQTQNRDILFYKLYPAVHELTVESDWSPPIGGGRFFNNTEVSISVEEEVVYADRDTRYVFSGWKSNSTRGVNSSERDLDFVLLGNVTQVADWVRQYYVYVLSTEGSRIEPVSGWYDEGTKLNLRVRPEEGRSFSRWEGSGPGSFDGNTSRGEVKVLGPITQVPVFVDQVYYNLTLVSDYGTVSGNGTYYENSYVSFSVSENVVDGRIGERFVFTGWTSDLENGYNGVKTRGSFMITEDVVLTANWEKQYFVNFTSTNEAELPSTGWYDCDIEITLSCQPGGGMYFERWEGEGVGSYSGPSPDVNIVVKGPIAEKAYLTDKETIVFNDMDNGTYLLNDTEKETYFINVLSQYGETTGSATYFEEETIEFRVYPEVIDLTENTRIVFGGWKSEFEYGYNGPNNPATIVLEGDTVQEAVWRRQFYVSSSDAAVAGWYYENESLPVDTSSEGGIIPKHREYSANGEILSELSRITGPLTLSSAWNYSLTKLALAGISSASIGFTAWSIMKRITNRRKKLKEVEEGDVEVKEKKNRFVFLTNLTSGLKRKGKAKPKDKETPASDEKVKGVLSSMMKNRVMMRSEGSQED